MSKVKVRVVSIQEYRGSPRMEVRIPRHVYNKMKFVFGHGNNGGYALVNEALTLTLRQALRLIYKCPSPDEEGTQNIWVKAPPELIEKAARAYVTPHTFIRAACLSIISKMEKSEKLQAALIKQAELDEQEAQEEVAAT